MAKNMHQRFAENLQEQVRLRRMREGYTNPTRVPLNPISNAIGAAHQAGTSLVHFTTGRPIYGVRSAYRAAKRAVAAVPGVAAARTALRIGQGIADKGKAPKAPKSPKMAGGPET